ncbi:MAG: hypothetical protein IM613_12245 [Cytophagales bacterium]|nr:hypothetical protein [Cytophagales bacterium]
MVKTCIARLYFHPNGAIVAKFLSDLTVVDSKSSEITGAHFESVIIDDEIPTNTSTTT